MRRLIGTSVVMLGLSVGLAQSPPHTLEILSPTADAFLVGESTFSAAVQPGQADVVSIEFFVDGRLACVARQAPFSCPAGVGDVIAPHTVRVIANLRNGERVVGTVRTAGGVVESAGVEVVLVPVVVTDSDGRAVRNLTGEAFQVRENGVPHAITLFKVETLPLDVAVAVDISLSMSDSMPPLIAAVNRFLDRLDAMRDGDRQVNVTLLAFNDRSFLLATPTTPADERRASVSALRASGETALYDVILQALDRLGRSIGLRAIVVFTDGVDQSSLAQIPGVERRLRESDATLHIITQGREAQIEAIRRTMNRLAEMTGGRTYAIERVDRLGQTFEAIMEDLSQQYLLGYSPPAPARDGSYRRIDVTTNVSSHTIRHRDGYYAPTR